MSPLSQLAPGEDYKISFGLSIAGTSTPPTEVRVSLGTDFKISSKAILNSSSNEYEATIPMWDTFIKGNEILLTIEVLLNGKLLVPYKEMINVTTLSATVNVKPEVGPEKTAKVFHNDLKAAINQPEPVKPTTFTLEDFLEPVKEEVKEPIKEEVKKDKNVKIDFTSIKKHDKINKPVTVNLAEMAEAKPIKKQVEEKVKSTVTEIKITKAPFRLIKTNIVEK